MVRNIRGFLRGIPGFAKVVMILQATIIVGLSAWIYNEYVNNQYLQMYLISLFQGKGSMIAFLGLGGLLVTALGGILLKAGNILGEIEHLSGEAPDQMGGVRKSGPEVPTPMPVLKIVEAEPVDKVGRLLDSLRRWNEQHGMTGKLLLEFQVPKELLVVRVNYLPELLPVLTDQRLPLESDLQGLIGMPEPINSDLWKT